MTRGVVAFVSNGGWIDGNTGDGVRLSLAEDYSDLYVFNLRGNQRTAGEQSRREGGKVFGSGSRNTVAVLIGVKQPGATGCTIHYRDIGDYLTAEEKLEIVDTSTIDSIEWEQITPNKHGDWLAQRSDNFSFHPSLQEDKTSSIPGFFIEKSLGVSTNRDTWTYNFANKRVSSKVEETVGYFNSLHEKPDEIDGEKIKWSSRLDRAIKNGEKIDFDPTRVRLAMYRPFAAQWTYFSSQLNDRPGKFERIFPQTRNENTALAVIAPQGRTPFSVFAVGMLPNLNFFMDAAHFFPRWTWEPVEAPEGELDFGSNSEVTAGAPGTAGEVLDGYRRVDNITDEIHALYREALGEDVTKDDIFYFVYGQLHDPGYREAYAADLKKILPHIETPTDRGRFDQLAKAGRELMELHIGYENVEPWPLGIQVKTTADPEDRETWRVTKLKWKKVRDPETKKLVEDRSTMIYNPKVTIAGIPLEADEYMLGSRSALAWIIDRYQVKKDKTSGIVNDPNDWADEVGNPRYIVDLIGKVTRVAVETTRIVSSLDSRKQSDN